MNFYSEHKLEEMRARARKRLDTPVRALWHDWICEHGLDCVCALIVLAGAVAIVWAKLNGVIG